MHSGYCTRKKKKKTTKNERKEKNGSLAVKNRKFLFLQFEIHSETKFFISYEEKANSLALAKTVKIRKTKKMNWNPKRMFFFASIQSELLMNEN